MKRITGLVLILILTVSLFSGCGAQNAAKSDEDGRLSVVATIFPPYDFVRQIAGERVSLKMLLSPGEEVHSFEPSPQDIIDIKDCDMFIYTGGESDAWVDGILSSMSTSKMQIIKLTEIVEPVVERLPEGISEQEAADEVEYDEHVWTSVANAIKIVNYISEKLCLMDEKNENEYIVNTNSYVKQLNLLKKDLSKIVETGLRKQIVFGDRFPMRYFADEFGLKYYAAFPGCAEETEPSASTVAFLINHVRQEQIPVVFYTEFSNQKIADTICAETGARKRLMHSCHNLTKQDFENGVTYIELMKQNADYLKEALN